VHPRLLHHMMLSPVTVCFSSEQTVESFGIARCRSKPAAVDVVDGDGQRCKQPCFGSNGVGKQLVKILSCNESYAAAVCTRTRTCLKRRTFTAQLPCPFAQLQRRLPCAPRVHNLLLLSQSLGAAAAVGCFFSPRDSAPPWLHASCPRRRRARREKV
jgi:hypothetical protein